MRHEDLIPLCHASQEKTWLPCLKNFLKIRKFITNCNICKIMVPARDREGTKRLCCLWTWKNSNSNERIGGIEQKKSKRHSDRWTKCRDNRKRPARQDTKISRLERHPLHTSGRIPKKPETFGYSPAFSTVRPLLFPPCKRENEYATFPVRTFYSENTACILFSSPGVTTTS
jgi:hypothetical protein